MVQRLFGSLQVCCGFWEGEMVKVLRFSIHFLYIWADVTLSFTVCHILLCTCVTFFFKVLLLWNVSFQSNFLIFWLKEEVPFSGKTMKSNVKIYSQSKMIFLCKYYLVVFCHLFLIVFAGNYTYILRDILWMFRYMWESPRK